MQIQLPGTTLNRESAGRYFGHVVIGIGALLLRARSLWSVVVPMLEKRHAARAQRQKRPWELAKELEPIFPGRRDLHSGG
jgi:hypothetical protein